MRMFRWLFLAMLCVGVAQGETVASMPQPARYVNDYADATTPAVRNEMETVCTELHDKTKAQIFVVTIKSLEGAPIEEFANDLFHKWKIGDKKTDRGVLMLYAIQDHRYRIEVGYGLESILNDARVGDIGRLMVPQLKSGDYNNALETSLRPVAQTIATDAGVILDSLGPPVKAADDPVGGGDPAKEEPKEPPFPLGVKIAIGLFALVFGGIVLLFIVAFVRQMLSGPTPYRSRPNRKGTGNFGSSGTSFSSSSSSDSSSSSSSSSTDSFSGGGGGDSGGGGASGSW